MTFTLVDNEIEQIIQLLIQVCIHPNIPVNNKRTIAEVLESSFHFLAIRIGKKREEGQIEGEDDQEGYSISKAFAEGVLKVLVDCKNNKNASIGAIMVLQSYLAALTHEKRLVEIRKLFLTHLIAMNNEILAEILTTLNTMKEEEFTEDNEKIQVMLNCYEVEHTFIDCINSIVRDCICKGNVGLEIFATNTGICNLLFQIIGVVGTNSKQCQQVLVSTTGLEKYDELVNKTKNKTCNVINHLLKFCVKHGLETRFIANNLMYMNYIVLTLSYITDMEDFNQFLEDNEDVRHLTIGLLENMIICTRSRMFSDFFARIRAKVITEVLFMFLLTSDKEYAYIEDDPKEFMNLALDVCDKQESKTVKTQAAKCLEAFGDKVDGCISFCSMFCIQAIDCYINNNQNNSETHMNYIVLMEFMKGKFLKNNPPEKIVETSILALAITSYLLPKRMDIINALNHMLVRNLDILLDSNTHVLVQARMALFYGYFTDIIFKEEDDKFKQSMEFLFRSLNNPDETIVVGYQACETLITLIGDKNLIPRIEALVSDFRL